MPERSQNPVIKNNFLSLQSSGDTQSPKHEVMVKDNMTNKGEGPWDLITWGRGYTCVSMDSGAQWEPARCAGSPHLPCGDLGQFI